MGTRQAEVLDTSGLYLFPILTEVDVVGNAIHRITHVLLRPAHFSGGDKDVCVDALVVVIPVLIAFRQIICTCLLEVFVGRRHLGEGHRIQRPNGGVCDSGDNAVHAGDPIVLNGTDQGRHAVLGVSVGHHRSSLDFLLRESSGDAAHHDGAPQKIFGVAPVERGTESLSHHVFAGQLGVGVDGFDLRDHHARSGVQRNLFVR